MRKKPLLVVSRNEPSAATSKELMSGDFAGSTRRVDFALVPPLSSLPQPARASSASVSPTLRIGLRQQPEREAREAHHHREHPVLRAHGLPGFVVEHESTVVRQGKGS